MAFDYAAPSTVEEAIALLVAGDGKVRPLAGGTDLIAQLHDGRFHAEAVVDLKRIPELHRIEVLGDGGVRIGATVPLTDISRHPVIRRDYPAIATACSLIGSVMIQNRATLAGNVGNASPSADGIPPLIVHDARALLAGPEGTRVVPVEDICTGPGQTSLRPGEFITGFSLPPPPARTSSHYVRFIPRNEMDIAVVGVGVALTLDSDPWVCRKARIALAAVAPTPVRAREAEVFLVGKPLLPGEPNHGGMAPGSEELPAVSPVTEEIFREAGRLARRAARPISDVRGSADYRLHLVEVLTRRALSATIRQLAADHGRSA